MAMFRFWGSDARGSDKSVGGVTPPMADDFPKGLSAARALCADPVWSRKRKARDFDDDDDDDDGDVSPLDANPAKRARVDHSVATPPETPAAARMDYFESPAAEASPEMERAKDALQYQFGLEILLKHDELRLINQELAKCQVALEQLRRCHLIPYPVNCPTPQQMLDISAGKGPALRSRPGEPVPKWAAPFGVVDGPYARHYAKWLIPDPMFDGVLPEWQGLAEGGKGRTAAEGRTTRNSSADASGIGKRPVRGLSGQRLQSLSNGYPQPKDKAGPCVLKRSDGQTVKLVCIDCNRENFSSTQGFINHCRIAHRRDFKSHEEAAVHCGHPLAVDDGGAVSGGGGGGAPAPAAPSPTAEEKPPASLASGLVHPFARTQALDDRDAYAALHSRITASLRLYEQGKLPGVTRIPRAPSSRSIKPKDKPAKSFVGTSETPYLSRLMQRRGFDSNLGEHVQDAKTKTDLGDLFLPGDEFEETEVPNARDAAPPGAMPPAAARLPASSNIMRVPARTTSPPPAAPGTRPASSKGFAGPHMSFSSTSSASASPGLPEKGAQRSAYEDEMDVDLSPNTMASNNAPSLVSDDGEYDDSDDGSASDSNESVETESVSDVAEINLEEDQDNVAPRPIHHRRASSSTAAKLKKDEPKHVTFVSPMRGPTKGKRKQKP